MISLLLQQLLVALVTGGSGFLGGHVVETFLEAGYRTILVIREKSFLLNSKTIQSWAERYPNSFQFMLCDLSNESTSLEGALLDSNRMISLKDVNCIINCASPFKRSYTNSIEDIVEPTFSIVKNVIKFAAAVRQSQLNSGDDKTAYEGSQSKKLRIVHVSSSAALRGAGQVPFNPTSLKDYSLPSPVQTTASKCLAHDKGMFSTVDWNICSKVDGRGMQSYQFVKTVSEQMIHEMALNIDCDLVSILPVTMLGPICKGQQDNTKHLCQKRSEANFSDNINDELQSFANAGISAQFIRDWQSGVLKQENRIIADVRDVALAILNAAEINLENISFRVAESENETPSVCLSPSAISKDCSKSKTQKGSIDWLKTGFYTHYDLLASCIRSRRFHRRRFIIGGSKRIEHSAIENILVTNGFSGGSLAVSETDMKNNASFRTDVDELNISKTSDSILLGGLGIICRKWEETILDTAIQYYNQNQV